jgi:hypothetical protein
VWVTLCHYPTTRPRLEGLRRPTAASCLAFSTPALLRCSPGWPRRRTRLHTCPSSRQREVDGSAPDCARFHAPSKAALEACLNGARPGCTIRCTTLGATQCFVNDALSVSAVRSWLRHLCELPTIRLLAAHAGACCLELCGISYHAATTTRLLANRDSVLRYRPSA